MPIKIKLTSEVKTHGVKTVIYGAPGVGKTVLCSTAPDTIIISAEQGLLSLSDKEVPFIEVSTVEDVEAVYKQLKNNNDFQTICLDSISEISEVCLELFKEEVVDKRQAYLKLAEKFNKLMRDFRDIKGKNIVFTAKQRRIEDEDTGRKQIEPYMPGRVLPINIPYFVDEVLYMDIGKSKEGEYRYLQCKTKYGYVVKDRSGKLNDKEPPNLTKLFNKIKGNSNG